MSRTHALIGIAALAAVFFGAGPLFSGSALAASTVVPAFDPSTSTPKTPVPPTVPTPPRPPVVTVPTPTPTTTTPTPDMGRLTPIVVTVPNPGGAPRFDDDRMRPVSTGTLNLNNLSSLSTMGQLLAAPVEKSNIPATPVLHKFENRALFLSGPGEAGPESSLSAMQALNEAKPIF